MHVRLEKIPWHAVKEIHGPSLKEIHGVSYPYLYHIPEAYPEAVALTSSVMKCSRIELLLLEPHMPESALERAVPSAHSWNID